ncbi:MAG: hypothetical protein LBQ61_05810 [Spirochaetales bacterium]|jgi:hypothetical protein|nr:hypothetical protein [Spirochaetales bacterium]
MTSKSSAPGPGAYFWRQAPLPGAVFLLRIAAGLYDHSLLVIILGLWGFYGFSRRALDPPAPGFKEAAALAVSLLTAAAGLGFFLESLGLIFRISLGLETRIPTVVCLFTLILTTVFGEALRYYRPRRLAREGEPPPREGPGDAILAFFVFLLEAAFFSWGFPYNYGEAALGLILALVLMIRGVLTLIKIFSQVFLKKEPPGPEEK